jgi:hypothetical protein
MWLWSSAHIISYVPIDHRVLQGDGLFGRPREKPLAGERQELCLSIGRKIEREEGSQDCQVGLRRVRHVTSEKVGSLHREPDAQLLCIEGIVCRAHSTRAVSSVERDDAQSRK